MNRRKFVLAALASGLVSSGQPQNSDLVVQVSYTGPGTVDSSHKVYVVLWDTPQFVDEKSQARPMKIKSVSAKSDTVRFNDVRSNPVYVSAVYDPTRTWDAKSSPLPRSSLGLYAKKRHTAEPIQLSPGKTITISLTFGDLSKSN